MNNNKRRDTSIIDKEILDRLYPKTLGTPEEEAIKSVRRIFNKEPSSDVDSHQKEEDQSGK